MLSLTSSSTGRGGTYEVPPIVTGAVLRNFRFLLQVLTDADGVVTVKSDDELAGALKKLLADPTERKALGERAFAVINRNRGAAERTVEELGKLL